MIAMSLWDIKERLEYLCDSTFSVKRGLNELCKNPTRRVLCHFTIRRCVWLQLKKKVTSHAFLGLLLTLYDIINDIFSIFYRRPNVRFDQKMDHDFPVINSFLFHSSQSRKLFVSKIDMCKSCFLYTAPHFHIRDLNQIKSVLEVNMDQLLIKSKKLISSPQTTKTI